MASLDKLVQQRGTIKRELTLLVTLISKLIDNSDNPDITYIDQVVMWLQRIEPTLDLFYDLQSKIVPLQINDPDFDYEDER